MLRVGRRRITAPIPERRQWHHPQKNKDLVRRHFEAIEQQDRRACADTLAEDLVFHQGVETHRGVEWFTNHWKGFYEAVPDASVTIDEIIAEDDQVAVRFTNVGTTDAEIPGFESTGTEIEFSSHLTARVEAGVFAELWVVAEQPQPVSQ